MSAFADTRIPLLPDLGATVRAAALGALQRHALRSMPRNRAERRAFASGKGVRGARGGVSHRAKQTSPENKIARQRKHTAQFLATVRSACLG